MQIPVIASGGAGSAAHFAEVFGRGKADAALAASIFHFGVTDSRELKAQLAAGGRQRAAALLDRLATIHTRVTEEVQTSCRRCALLLPSWRSGRMALQGRYAPRASID